MCKTPGPARLKQMDTHKKNTPTVHVDKAWFTLRLRYGAGEMLKKVKNIPNVNPSNSWTRDTAWTRRDNGGF